MENGAREVRRRRIVERGSDRLAFITGKIQSLPSSPPNNLNAVSRGEDDTSDPVSPKCNPISEAIRTTLDTDSEVQSLISSSSEIVRNPLDTDNEIQPSISSELLNSSNSTSDIRPHVEPCHSRLFTATQIISSISASENIRLLCSFLIALLVVLSGHSDPLGSSIIRNIVAYRPLYLVLLTDVTIVLGLLLLRSRGTCEKGEETARITGEEEYGWADRVGKALEVGLVVQKAMNAAFMDCSVYAVLLISGLSLRQYCL
ncbi:uncharacterized protein LOC143883560 [Tasmannia lanceolata]|uniref:uncharacterized protein LOC143883560 n=1 Tax=Tasmannia lanceolata TaxID=3420 RepID=UPI004063FA38